MTLSPTLRVTVAPWPAAPIRLVTIVLAFLLAMLAVLAAHHVQMAQGESRPPVLTELGAAHQPLAERGAGAPETSAAEYMTTGLAAGCVALTVCCVLGLALLAAGAWRAKLFRRLGSAAPPLRSIVIAAMPAPLGVGAAPGLIVLSISRT